MFSLGYWPEHLLDQEACARRKLQTAALVDPDRDVQHLARGLQPEIPGEQPDVVSVFCNPCGGNLHAQHVAGRGHEHPQPRLIEQDTCVGVNRARKETLDAIV